jgi:REP element-mobilizing transposase RayT
MVVEAPKFRNKYRIATSRLKGWDYGEAGYYFITICTQDKHLWFGEIQNCEMRRSFLGEIAYQYWLDIPKHFPQASLDEFIVMPNHVRGIIVLNAAEIREGTVETQHAASLQGHMPKPGSI